MHLLSLSIDSPNISAGPQPTIPIYGPSGVPVGGLTDAGPNGTVSGQTIIQNGITIVIALAIVLALFFLIWGGIQWIMSAGDKHKIDAARTRIMYALIGLLIIFFSFFIVLTIGKFFGIDAFHIPLVASDCSNGGPC